MSVGTSENSLFVRPPKIKMTDEMHRLHLLKERFEFEELLGGLGTPDEVLVVKKELERELKRCIVEKSLSTDLQILVDKIKPLGIVYLPKKDTAYLSDMCSSIDKIADRLPENGSQKMGELLKRLKNLYQKEPSIELETLRASLQGLTTSFRYISPQILDRLLPLDAQGKVIKSKTGAQGGTRAVNSSGKIFCKNDPEAPAHQEGWNRFLQIFFNIRTAASQFARVHRSDGKGEYAFNTQFSLDVESDMSLAKVVTEQPHLIHKMNDFLYGMIAISHMVGGPQDASENNFGVKLIKDKEGNVVDLLPLGFDDDRWGVLFPCYGGKNTHFNNMRSIFLTMKKIYQPIDPRIRQHFIKLNPARAILQFIQEMMEYNQELWELQKGENIPAEKMQEMSLPYLMLRDLIPTFYERFCKIREFMRTSTPEKSYMDLWKEVYPPLAYFYDSVNRRHPNDFYQAFLKIFVRGGPVYEEEMQAMLNRPLIGNEPLSEYLKTCKQGADDYEALRDTPPEIAAEQWLEKDLDFMIYSDEEQKEILKKLQQTTLSQMTLRNCSVISDLKIRSLLSKQPHLQKLTLIGCHHLTDIALQAIFLSHPDLELVICDCPGISPAGLSALTSKKIVLKKREELTFRQHLPVANPAADPAFQELSEALQKGDWKKVKEHYTSLEGIQLRAKAAIHIVQNLTTTDMMRTIVQTHRIDALEFLVQIDFQLTLKNIKDESLFLLCCEEGNEKMLQWLCQQKVKWEEVEDTRGATPCHVAVTHNKTACLNILKEAGAPIDKQDKARISPLRLAIERKDVANAKWLISAGATLEDFNWHKQSLAHFTCRVGLNEILDLILQKSPHLAHGVDDKGKMPLNEAIEYNHEECFSKALSRMKSVEYADLKGQTPLMQAAQLDRPKMVIELLKRGAKSEESLQDGMNAIQISTLAGSFSSVKTLLGEKPSPKAMQLVLKDGKTLLHLAAMSGNDELVRWLYRPEMLVKTDDEGFTPAHYAAQAGHWKVFQILLEFGFPIDFQDNPKRETCLMIAFRGHRYEMAEKMIAAKASMEAKDHKKMTIVHRAAIDGDVELLRYLIGKQPSSVNARAENIDKATPLHLAAAKGHLQAIDLLLSLNAERNPKTPDGKTPLFMAVMNGQEEAVTLLINRGSDVNATMHDGFTLLHYAAWYGHPKLISHLLSLQPDLIQRKTVSEGHSALHRAMYQRIDEFQGTPEEKEKVRQKQIETVRTLLRFGAEVDARDHLDFTPLHLTGRWGRPDFARLLLSRGASIHARYDKNKVNGEKSELGECRTPEEHCYFMMQKTDGALREGIHETAKLLQEHTRSLKHAKSVLQKQGSIFSSEKLFTDQLLKPLEERKKNFLDVVKSDGGFRFESLILLRSIEEQLEASQLQESSPFRQQLQALISNLSWPKAVADHRTTIKVALPLTNQQICERWLSGNINPTHLNDLTLIIPLIGKPVETLQKLQELSESSPPLQEGQLKAVCALLANFRGHEAWTASDFAKENCQKLAKSLGKFKKELKESVSPARDFLEDAAGSFPKMRIETEWKRKGIPERRSKLIEELLEVFNKNQADKRETLIDQLTRTCMALHREWFSHTRMSDFRTISEVSSKEQFSFLSELKRASEDLTANCLIFLHQGKNYPSYAQRIEFVLEWMNKSVLYGDFQQALALFEAVTHPSVTRLKKAYERLGNQSRRLLLHGESLFSPADDYQNYFNCLRIRLSPSIPSFAIYARLYTVRETLDTRFALMRHFQEHRAFATKLIIPPANLSSELLLMLTSELFPVEYSRRKAGTKPGEDYAWEHSHQLKPPELKKEKGLALSLKKPE